MELTEENNWLRNANKKLKSTMKEQGHQIKILKDIIDQSNPREEPK